MKRVLTYVLVIAGSFIIGFLTFYFLMPVIVRHSKTVDVPHLKHMTYSESRDFLLSLGLKCTISDSVHSREVQRGRVVETDPPVKKEVKLGSLIELIISKGPQKIRFPKIVGLDKEAAIDSLSVHGITNLVIVNVPVEEEEEDGKVVKTRPSFEDSLERGGKLTIFIGKEKRKVFLMPNLIGLSLEEAKELLEDYELEMAPVKWTESSKEEVLLQSPLAGVEVTLGDTVKLVVGRK